MRIRFLTFNTGSFLAHSAADGPLTLGPATYSAKSDAVVEALERARPDIFALQEVVDRSAAERVATALGSEYRVLAASDHGSRGIRTWLVSRLPVKSVEVHDDACDLLQWEGQPLPHRRVIIDALFPVRPGVEVRVLAMHLKSKRAILPGLQGEWSPSSLSEWAMGVAYSSSKRAAQAVALRRLVDHHFDDDPEARLLILGDLNDTPDSITLGMIRGDHAAARSAALRRRELESVTTGMPNDRRFTHIYRGRKMQLDHILVSRSMWRGFAGAEIHNELLLSGSIGAEREVGESDHAPILADFRV
jgi:endonuclease/exonuclease/phosphatase family metal-dependent hydrolase